MQGGKLTKKIHIGQLFISFIMALTLVAAPFFNVPITKADTSISWVGNDPTWEVLDVGVTTPLQTYTSQTCEQKDVTVGVYNSWLHTWSTSDVSDCFIETPYGSVGETYYKPLYSKVAGQLGGSIKMALSASNDIFMLTSAPNYGLYLKKYADAGSNIQATSASPYPNYDNYQTAEFLMDENANLIKLNGLKPSKNGKWAIARVQSAAFIRINLETFTFMIFGTPNSNGVGSYVISNDGQHVFAQEQSWGSYTMQTYDLSTCVPPTQPKSMTAATGCGNKDMTSYFNGYDVIGNYFEFSTDATQLSFIYDDNGTNKMVNLTAPGQEIEQLEYLAMGDSFSSGEGELNDRSSTGDSHYLEGTNIQPTSLLPEGEKCHVSDRSYPFILARNMGLSSTEFRSVACSGALIEDVTRTDGGYEGQNARLKELSQPERDIANHNALNHFIPGRITQIQFVEEYKPKIVTISIGGNDVNFDGKIETCAGVGTCEYADDQEIARAASGFEIDSLLSELKAAYTAIHEVSFATKIYVIGYPLFVEDVSPSCDANVHLDSYELEFVNKSTKWMNKIIKTASEQAGVMYLDIENSMGNNVLCGSGQPKAINGLTTGGDKSLDFLAGLVACSTAVRNDVGGSCDVIGSESYHPNQLGHQKMANEIMGQVDDLSSGADLLSYNYAARSNGSCPGTTQTICKVSSSDQGPIPSYFNSGVPPPRNFLQKIQHGDMYSGQVATINVDQLQPGSTVLPSIHSTPIDLGTYVADSNGILQDTITIPSNAPAGYHTLHIFATSKSGEAIDIYQTVFIVGPEDDIDGDSVDDITQSCLLVPVSNTDADRDGVDDACDGDIGEPKLYQARYGDPVNSESADKVYIERNMLASSTTGITGEYDPDDDNWATVGVSDSGANIANFWVDSNHVPHLSSRSAENGCVQYTPTSLLVVQANQMRTLDVETANTDTCRAEAVDYDVDFDGVPDDEQALYRARNGDEDASENPDLIYLERNRHASEAQLSLSDYISTPNTNNSTWAHIGISTSLSAGTFNKLLIVNNEPVILYKDSLDVCRALTSNQHTVVKQSELTTRTLQTTNIPTGEDCD